MPDNVINLLMACSIENSAAIQHALGHHAPRMRIHRVDSAQELQQALDFPGWHLAFSELEQADFSAFDLVSLLDDLI